MAPVVEQVRFSGLIQHLQEVLSRRFSSRVARIYYGDIGIYPPAVFGTSRATQKAIIALTPIYNKELENQRTAISENREYGLRIVVMMNITPFFEASPTEAYAERQLTELAEEIATFLTQQENVQLGGRVQWSSVGDIEYGWIQRESENTVQYIRAAAVEYSARVRVKRAKDQPQPPTP